ncbi:LysR family transcriptional regulator [Psychrosphaera algicola]|uniref:LysR family transcriptional regulator n=1 Tax=Psychrosphaera algicola TaxID=3023714 RepID=A0ABT5FCE9_9GAMM|nr:LysR family transcriptional regulator [Psychrosphaera sp. G1-22]MDC2888523.1 LysR family transcriptional regulator [Psychrosphaera sp. G1-22]
MITIDQLKVLEAIAEEKSLRAAASRLHKTQPALSHSVKQLEVQLGLALFTRDSYRLSLTSAGKSIYQMAQKALRDVSQIEQYANHLNQGNEANIVIAVEAAFPIEPLFSAFEQVHKNFPSTQLSITQEYVTGALQLVSEGKAQIAITAAPIDYLAKFSGLIAIELSKGEMVNVATPQLLDKYKPFNSIESLINENQIIVKDTGEITKDVELNTQSGQSCWYVNNFEAKLKLICHNLGWGMLPRHLVSQHIISGTLQEIKVADKESSMTFPFCLVKNKSHLLGPVATEIWRTLSKLDLEE